MCIAITQNQINVFVCQYLLQQVYGCLSKGWWSAQIGLWHEHQSRNTERPIRITNEEIQSDPLESPGSQWEGEVQWRLQSRGLKGATVSSWQVLIIVSVLLKEQTEQLRLEGPAAADWGKPALSFQGVVHCKYILRCIPDWTYRVIFSYASSSTLYPCE